MNDLDMVIGNEEEWNRFVAEGLDTIVDPMIFRTADVYLRGRRGAGESLPDKEPDQVWNAVSANVGSLVAFFDALILSDRLPIIDYGSTFDSNIGFDQHDLYHRCNQAAEENVLVSVHVMGPAYWDAKAAAVETLLQRPTLPPSLSASVLEEMSAFDYAWKPDLSALGPLGEGEEVLMRFLYGGMLFSAYAQTTGASHLIQPKRSRLYLAMSLGAGSAAYEYERELHQELSQVVRQTAGMEEGMFELEALPPFLPYLLSQDPETPAGLLASALELRKTGMVRDYRQWRRQLLRDWRDRGRIDRENEREVKRIAQAVTRELQVTEEEPVELKFGLGLTGVGLDVGVPIPVRRLWGWVLQQLPGRRYTKLLMRMQVANREYRRLDRHLLTLWNQA